MVGGEGRCEGISANPYDGYDVTLMNATLSGNFYKHAWIHVVTLFYSCHTEIQEDSGSLIKKSALVITPV